MVNNMAEKIPVREGTFMESPDGGILLANRCKSCGQIFFPKALFCFTCLTEDMEEVKLSRRGKLYSYTIGHMPSLHFQPPYAIGYIEMPEGVKVFAPLKMMEDRPLKIGMEMEVFIDTLWQQGDNEVIGYKFRAV
jgi:uncharacterized OB-fold protein